jgi:peptide/nickel transport system substrate-binding protein
MKKPCNSIAFSLRNFIFALSLIASLLFIQGCSKKPNTEKNYVVIGIEGDIDTFNPLYAEDANAGEMLDLTYPELVTHRFDPSKGAIIQMPGLARSWEFENGDKDIKFHLKSNAKWSDGYPVTAHDVLLSYELYGDTSVASVRQDAVSGMLKTAGVPDVARSIEVKDDSTVVFHYDHPYAGQLFDAGLPLVPAHIYEHINKKDLKTDSSSRQPLGAGPYLVKSWKPTQEIVLASNQTSVSPHPGKIPEMIFRVIPDYHQRLMQLRSGEIDVLPYIEIEDAAALTQQNAPFTINPLGERFYDAINWNNIDPESYSKSNGKQIRPHQLFGTVKVRQALTLAIDRQEIVDTYLHSFGQVAYAPVSPLFRWAFNDTLKPLPFNPDSAKKLLAQEGWRESESDGILEKNGKKFSFTLKIPAGNQLRASIASIVQQQLKAISIEVKIQQEEHAAFWGEILAKNFDACIAGFNVPLQMQLDELWGGDLAQSRFNIPSFRNDRVDEILKGARSVRQETEYAHEWKEFQEIILREQPCTFLYWLNDLVAVNNRVRNTNIDPLGITYHAADWELQER